MQSNFWKDKPMFYTKKGLTFLVQRLPAATVVLVLYEMQKELEAKNRRQ